MNKDFLNNIKNSKNTALFAKIFIGTVAIHWLLMFVGFYLMKLSGIPDATFFAYMYDKFSVSGDTPHYMYIAENGYASFGDKINLIVFYPLFPLLMKIFGFIFGDVFVAGIFVSNVCLGISGYYLYKICEREFGYLKARDAMALYILYPTGAFLCGVFTESLFIMLALMCLYYIRDKKWILAGITGYLAALAKSQGIALLVPAIYEAVIYMVKKKKFDISSVMVMLIPCGTLTYLLINYVVLGDPMAFIQHQAAEPWYNTSHWISDNITQHFGMGMDDSLFGLSIIIYWAQFILYFVGVFAMFYGIKKKVRTSYIAFGGAYIFLSYLHGWLISGPRYMMSCVTLYIVYAAGDNKYVKQFILVAAGVLAVFFTYGIWYGEAIM